MISAIITCAGNHSRFGTNKLLELLDGKPIFIRTLEQFQKSKKIDEIVVPARKEKISLFKNLIKKTGIKVKLVEGGNERYVSAYNGVKASGGQFILVHDGARPLVSLRLIDKIIEEVKKHDAVMMAVEPHTCIKQSSGFYVKQCLSRSETWLGQTPQAFKREIILKAYEKAIKDKEFNGMDDCELVSRLGIKVKIVPGDQMNIKVTIPSDLVIARHFFKIRKEIKNV
jgi:2-C-methyl-D-erythritol 4-phosphate cytidylyltransferase